MRILQVVDYMNRAGLETFLMNVYRNIDRNQIQFDFITKTDKKCDYDDEILSLGGNIYSSPSTKNSSISNVKKFYLDFFKQHPEYKIIHMHISYFSPTNMVILLAAKKAKVSCRIVHSHSSNVKGKARMFLHKFNQKIAEIFGLYTEKLACSNDAGKWIFGENNFKSIHNGIELQRFEYDKTTRLNERNKLKLTDELVLGHVGRFTTEKNHKYILSIFQKVKMKNDNSKLLLVGNGKLLDEVKNMAKKMDIEDSIIFTGVRPDVNNLMQAMDAFVFPSLYEGLPVTLVEAQASGLPCFVADNLPKDIKITDLVKFVSLEDSADVWAEKIVNKCVDHKRLSMSNEIHKARYDISDTVKELTQLYRSI